MEWKCDVFCAKDKNLIGFDGVPPVAYGDISISDNIYLKFITMVLTLRM